jgi:hypothetical protein
MTTTHDKLITSYLTPDRFSFDNQKLSEVFEAEMFSLVFRHRDVSPEIGELAKMIEAQMAAVVFEVKRASGAIVSTTVARHDQNLHHSILAGLKHVAETKSVKQSDRLACYEFLIEVVG